MRQIIITLFMALGLWPMAHAELNCAKDVRRLKAIESKLMELNPSNEDERVRGMSYTGEIFSLHDDYSALDIGDECAIPMWKAFVSLEVVFQLYNDQTDNAMFLMIGDIAKNPNVSDVMVETAAAFPAHHQSSRKATCMLQSFRSRLHGHFCFFETAKQKCFEEQTSFDDCMK